MSIGMQKINFFEEGNLYVIAFIATNQMLSLSAF